MTNGSHHISGKILYAAICHTFGSHYKNFVIRLSYTLGCIKSETQKKQKQTLVATGVRHFNGLPVLWFAANLQFLVVRF